MPTKSMLSQPVGVFILVVAVVIGIVYVLYPAMFRNEEAETEAFVHPVPPGGASEDEGYGYHYREAC